MQGYLPSRSWPSGNRKPALSSSLAATVSWGNTWPALPLMLLTCGSSRRKEQLFSGRCCASTWTVSLLNFHLTLGSHLPFVPPFPHLWKMDVKLDDWLGLTSGILWALMTLLLFHLLGFRFIGLFLLRFALICCRHESPSCLGFLFYFWPVSCKAYSRILCQAWDVTEYSPRSFHRKHFSPIENGFIIQNWEWIAGRITLFSLQAFRVLNSGLFEVLSSTEFIAVISYF